MRQRSRRGSGIRRLASGVSALAVAALTATGCSAGTDMVGAHPAAPTLGYGSIAPSTAAGGTGGGASSPSCNPAASSLAPSASAVDGQDVQRIKKQGYIRIGVAADEYLAGYLNASGDEEGFDIDLANALATSLFGTPKAARFVVLTADQRIPALQEDKVDLVIDTMTITCDRLQKVGFSAVYFEAAQQLLVPTGSPYTDISKLKGQKVCAQTGSTSVAQIQHANATAVTVTNVTDCLMLLQQNGVVAVSTDNTLLAGLAAQDPNLHIYGQPLEPEPYGIAMPHGESDLERYVNGVLAQYESSGQWEQSYRNWFSKLGPAQPPVARYSD